MVKALEQRFMGSSKRFTVRKYGTDERTDCASHEEILKVIGTEDPAKFDISSNLTGNSIGAHKYVAAGRSATGLYGL